VADYGATGKIPPRVGTGHNSLTPYQAFEAADGPVVIAAGNDRLFAKMAGVLGHSEWVNDPRFATNAERTRNRDTLLPMIVELPCAPINSVPQVVAHEQTHAIGMLLDSQNEQLKIMGLPLSIDGQRPGFGAKAPALGEHQQSLSE
jgi:formyl-CoA transferase